MIATGLVLVAVEAARAGRQVRTSAPDETSGVSSRRFLVNRWRHSFLLVLLLAIGPAILALAMATSRKPPRYERQFTTTTAGVQQETSYLVVNDPPSAGELQLGQKLLISAALILTVLVHGAMAISIGLGLTTVSVWSRRTLGAVLSLTVLMVFMIPLYLFLLFDSSHEMATAMWTIVMASGSLLTILVTRRSSSFGDILLSVLFWDVIFGLIALGLSLWTIWYWQRQSGGWARSKRALATDQVNI